MCKLIKTPIVLFAVMFAFIAGSTIQEREFAKAGDQRYLRGYTGPYETGASYEYQDYAPDLSDQGMTDVIVSACYTGIWILYDDTNYDGGSCFTAKIDWCGNFTSCIGTASSLRYAGSPYGLNDNFFNLYESLSFVGNEFRGNTDVDNLGELDAAASSLVITGQSAWTFYSGIQQTGSSVCVYPYHQLVGDDGIFVNYAAYCRLSEIGLPDNSIRSVARGCLSDRVVREPLPNGTTVHSVKLVE